MREIITIKNKNNNTKNSKRNIGQNAVTFIKYS